MKALRFALVALAVIALATPGSAMTITPFDSGTNLAQTLVGPGITISNVTYTGVAVASGYFSGGIAAGIGIDTGVVLTSGDASILNGTTNTQDAATGANYLSGDADLASLVPGYYTYDATILAFDFVSSGDAAYFNYVFGSEEYNEYTNTSYNDVFGFFFNGNNVALIPGTTTPVSINNVNGGNPYGSGASNPTYYNNNDLNDGGPFYPFEYDGFTDAFTASITGLTPGATYHIKLAISDSGDYVLDSGVFLQAGSFSDTPIPTPEPATVLLVGVGLLGLGLVSRKRR